MIITHVFPRIFKLIEWRDSLRILKSRTSRTTRRTDSGAAFLLLEVLIVNTMRYGAIARRSITFRKDNRNFLFDGEDHSLRGKKRRELYRHWSWFINWWFNKIVSLEAECFLSWNSVALNGSLECSKKFAGNQEHQVNWKQVENWKYLLIKKAAKPAHIFYDKPNDAPQFERKPRLDLRTMIQSVFCDLFTVCCV